LSELDFQKRRDTTRKSSSISRMSILSEEQDISEVTVDPEDSEISKQWIERLNEVLEENQRALSMSPVRLQKRFGKDDPTAAYQLKLCQYLGDKHPNYQRPRSTKRSSYKSTFASNL
jgi:hypothetical protein